MKDLLENINKFEWKELDGKVLKIIVGEDVLDGVKSVCVMGLDARTGHYYALHTETKRLNIDPIRMLSEETGENMMECKKALFATNGDFNKAIEYLSRPNRVNHYV